VTNALCGTSQITHVVAESRGRLSWQRRSARRPRPSPVYPRKTAEAAGKLSRRGGVGSAALRAARLERRRYHTSFRTSRIAPSGSFSFRTRAWVSASAGRSGVPDFPGLKPGVRGPSFPLPCLPLLHWAAGAGPGRLFRRRGVGSAALRAARLQRRRYHTSFRTGRIAPSGSFSFRAGDAAGLAKDGSARMAMSMLCGFPGLPPGVGAVLGRFR
jgi:hypothetical protein